MVLKIKISSLEIKLSNLTLKSKLQTLVLAVSLVTVGLIDWASYSQERSLIGEQISQNLQLIRDFKGEQIELLFNNIYDEVHLISGDLRVIEALDELSSGLDNLKGKKGLNTGTFETSLEAYYREQVFPKLSKNLSDRELKYSTYRPSAATARYLQYHYLVRDSEEDGSRYAKAHIKHHQFLKQLVETQGYDNLFLIDKRGNLIYSTFKQTDYGTNLLQGLYSQSGLADAVRATLSDRDPGSIQVTDFKAYRPSALAPAGFVSTPIYQNSKLIGILVIQLPIDKINEVMAQAHNFDSSGLGKTGEVYLVGSDSLMRSLSRAWVESRDRYKDDVRQQGTSERTLRQMDNLQTTIGLQKVENSLVKAGLGGQEGVENIVNYRGQEVLSAYGTLDLPGLDWAIVAEIEVEEAYEHLYALQIQLSIAAAIFLLFINVLAAIASNIFVQPIRELIESTKKIGAGELETEISVTSDDEIGQLGRSVEAIVEDLRHTHQKLQKQKQKNDRLLHNFLPDSAVERFKNGETLIADQSNQATFVYAQVVGITELSKRMSSQEVTAVLSKLFNEFDRSAEEYGVDRQTTIGATYIAVCGLSQPRLDHTKRAIEFAQSMLDILERLGFNYNPVLGLRIGIHAGSATAGVVGSEKYSYIIWGEDIYLVSRLYAQAEPNRIVLTRNAYERVADAHVFVKNASVDIQGIGQVESWTMFTKSKLANDKVDLVQSSFAKVIPIADKVAPLFYQRLFELEPSLQVLFKSDMQKLQQKLMSALAVAVEGLETPEKILPTVQQLGRRHVGYGAKDEHYEVVIKALIWTLEQGLGDEFTLPVRNAWQEALTLVSDLMKDAAAGERGRGGEGERGRRGDAETGRRGDAETRRI